MNSIFSIFNSSQDLEMNTESSTCSKISSFQPLNHDFDSEEVKDDGHVRSVWAFFDENEENVISSKEEEEEAISLRTKQDVIPEDDADNDFAYEEVCNLQKKKS